MFTGEAFLSAHFFSKNFVRIWRIMMNGILFICLGNSCRSIMAEALARQFFRDSVRVSSAGINPLGYVAQETLQVLAEAGAATEGLWSKGLTEIDCAPYALLVNLTNYSLDAILPRDCRGRIIHHPVADPFGRSLEAYRQTLKAIRRFITEDLPPLLRQGQRGALLA
jgi:protein-tyrosine-phosphatase